MMSSNLWWIFAFTLASMVAAAPKGAEKKHPSCQEFSQGVVFNESLVLDTWHMLHFNNDKTKGSNKNCVTFIPISDQDRKELSDRIGKYVENLKWESLTMKMRTPCVEIKSNQTRDYYLERLGDDGSYRTLQLPPATGKLNISEIHRYPMRLKIIEGQYLAMMDCQEKFIFLMGKEQLQGKGEEKVKKLLDIFWAEEN